MSNVCLDKLTKVVEKQASELNRSVLSYLELRNDFLDNLISITQSGIDGKIDADVVFHLVKENKTILLFLFQKMECDGESFDIMISASKIDTLKAIKKWLIELRKVNQKRTKDIIKLIT